MVQEFHNKNFNNCQSNRNNKGKIINQNNHFKSFLRGNGVFSSPPHHSHAHDIQEVAFKCSKFSSGTRITSEIWIIIIHFEVNYSSLFSFTASSTPCLINIRASFKFSSFCLITTAIRLIIASISPSDNFLFSLN